MNEKFENKISDIIVYLGLNKNDLNHILRNSKPTQEIISVSNGPPWYPGCRYGAISIKDFKIFI